MRINWLVVIIFLIIVISAGCSSDGTNPEPVTIMEYPEPVTIMEYEGKILASGSGTWNEGVTYVYMDNTEVIVLYGHIELHEGVKYKLTVVRDPRIYVDPVRKLLKIQELEQ